MKRRKALETLGKAAVAGIVASKMPYIAAREVPYVFASNGPGLEEELNRNLLEQGIYDRKFFEAAESIMPLDSNSGVVSILPKKSKYFSVRLVFSDPDKLSIYPTRTAEIPVNGDGEPVNIPVFLGNRFSGNKPSTKLKYQLQYREGNGSWKSMPWREANIPGSFMDVDNSEPIRGNFLSDSHIFDDRNYISDPQLRELRMSGDYINLFVTRLSNDPKYRPQGEEARLPYGFCFASSLDQIKKRNSQFVVNMGDFWRGGKHAWKEMGLEEEYTDPELYDLAKMFNIGVRKMYSKISPEIPISQALGNHDGENGWDPRLRKFNVELRKKHMPAPGEAQGCSPDQSFYRMNWGAYAGIGGPYNPYQYLLSIFILDPTGHIPDQPKKIQDWTLGEEQKKWFKDSLSKNSAMFNIACSHHVLGGWPTESDPNIYLMSDDGLPYFYARGPMFEDWQYRKLVKIVPEKLLGDLGKVEQTELTELFKQHGGRIWFYGHDHVFKPRKIGKNSNGQDVYGICTGSTNYELYKIWVDNKTFWQNKEIGYGDSGGYGAGATGHGDFLGPPGVTELEVHGDGRANVKYIRTADITRLTNLDPTSKVGDVLYQMEI